MSPLDLLLIALVAVAIWAVVELALTIRRARASVDEVTKTANETIEQVQPVIAKLDGAMDDLQPSIKQVDPLVEKAGVAVDQANESLRRVNGILGDVSTVSGTAAGVTEAVNKVAGEAANSVGAVVSRIAGKPAQGEAKHLEPAPGTEREDDAPRDRGYVTYGEAAADAPAEEENGQDR